MLAVIHRNVVELWKVDYINANALQWGKAAATWIAMASDLKHDCSGFNVGTVDCRKHFTHEFHYLISQCFDRWLSDHANLLLQLDNQPAIHCTPWQQSTVKLLKKCWSKFDKRSQLWLESLWVTLRLIVGLGHYLLHIGFSSLAHTPLQHPLSLAVITCTVSHQNELWETFLMRNFMQQIVTTYLHAIRRT